MAFILRPLPRSIGMGKEHFGVPVLALGKVSEFRTVVNGNGFEHLGEAVTIFRFQHSHSCHDRLIDFSRNQEGYVGFRFPTTVSPSQCPPSVR